ncbi:MAG TPA: diacylglycerol kinase family protein [Solirubrobacteraceae bacterium]|nr:diacylglycerol kinase family protein [Solirubrobacteraceae bacterium]
MAEQICLVGNPQAGSGQAHNIASAVQERLRARGFAVRTVRVVAREEVSALAESAGAEGETLVAIGGDGIIAAAADGLRRAGGGRLGVIPAGRGNDLARTLGIPRQPTAACEVIAAGATRALDLGVIGDRAFIGIASVGFDSEANRAANEAPAFLGGGAYAYGAMRALARWRPAHFEVIYREAPLGADGASQTGARAERFSFEGYTVALANTPFYGSGMRVAPRARPDDGALELVTVGRMSRGRFLANLPRVFHGTHAQLAEVQMARCTEATVRADRPFVMYADGDPISPLPARVRLLPKAIEVLAPPLRESAGAPVERSGTLPANR